MLKYPIFIIGAARSGTTILGKILSKHPDIAYWIEPKYIWRYGNPLSKDDVRLASEATDRIRNYIRRTFEKYVRKQGKIRYMDKTPSNCFRIPFIHQVFPDARYIHIIRDGRDVAFSAMNKWSSPPDKSALIRRALSFEIPAREFPAYASHFIRDVVARQLFPQKSFIWGPHFPGIREYRSNHSLLETCAAQWGESYTAALRGFESIPSSNVLSIKFEQFVESPVTKLEEIVSFLELKQDFGLLDYGHTTVNSNNANRWKTRDGAQILEVESVITPILLKAGYSLQKDG